jgi:hypothetical protein
LTACSTCKLLHLQTQRPGASASYMNIFNRAKANLTAAGKGTMFWLFVLMTFELPARLLVPAVTFDTACLGPVACRFRLIILARAGFHYQL